MIITGCAVAYILFLLCIIIGHKKKHPWLIVTGVLIWGITVMVLWRTLGTRLEAYSSEGVLRGG